MPPRDVADADSGELFVDDLLGFQAALVLLQDGGHVDNVEFGEDVDTQTFVRQVRRLNPQWLPGMRPNVPRRWPVIHVPTRPRSQGRSPRSRRVRGTQRARAPARSTDAGDGEPDLETLIREAVEAAFDRVLGEQS